MKSLGEKLVDKLRDLSNCEVAIIQVNSAIYIKEIDNAILSGKERIENSFIAEAKGYKIKEDVYNEKLKTIIDKYTLAIEKLRKEYEIQYANLQLEIQEAMANQQIAVVNAKSIVDLRNEFKNSSKYDDYLRVKKELEVKLDNALKKDEFDRYTELLENLSDPLEVYKQKMDSSIQKFYSYSQLIEECEKRLEDSQVKAIEEISKTIDSIISTALTVNNNSLMSKIMNAISGLFGGKAKYEKRVVEYENFVSNLESNESTIDAIREKTIDYLSELKVIKNEIAKIGA